MPLTYRYNVVPNGAKFINYFEANDYAHANNGYVDFKLDHADINSFLSVDVEKIRETDIETIYKDKLSWCRENFDQLRLLYSAGNDSHTILKLSQEMGIEFDEVVLETCSIKQDPALDAELLPGIEYARQTNVKNFVVKRPEVKHFERYLSPNWVNDVCGSQQFGFRGARIDVTLRQDPPMTCLSGFDTSYIYVSAEGKHYWVITDYPFSEYMRFDHVAFFTDSFKPETAVKQALMTKKFLQERLPNFRGLFTGPGDSKFSMTLDEKKAYQSYIGRKKPLSPLSADPTIMGKKIPAYRSEKHAGVMRELEEMGRTDLVKAFFDSVETIKKKYKDHDYCLSVDAEGHPLWILRFAAVFELGDDYIKHVSDRVIKI